MLSCPPTFCERIFSCSPVTLTQSVAATIRCRFVALAIARLQFIEANQVLGQLIRMMFDVRGQPLDLALLESDGAARRICLAKRALVRADSSALTGRAQAVFGMLSRMCITQCCIEPDLIQLDEQERVRAIEEA